MLDAVNQPGVVAEVERCFEAYDWALLANDIAVLDGWFWESDHAVRYGLGEELYGFAAIARHRRSVGGVKRGPLTRRQVITFGPDVATVCVEFADDSDDTGRGRQTQTWIRGPEGWRIVCAHVSWRDGPQGPRRVT